MSATEASAAKKTARKVVLAEQPGPERRAAARIMFESTPGMTCDIVSKETGVPAGTVRRWKAEDKWRPAGKLPELSARAGQLANTFKHRMSELGKPLSDETAVQEAAKELAEQEAVNIRAAVLDRHRTEWSAPRKIAYEAVQRGDFDRAKLAKITAETLTLIQVGECRAYGIDHKARGDDNAVVVIDRDGSE